MPSGRGRPPGPIRIDTYLGHGIRYEYPPECTAARNRAGTNAPSVAVPVRPESARFWEEVASVPGGEAVTACIQCNTCTCSCPVELLEPAFNVRRLVARVRLGLREDVLSDDALWACARCHACVARCPRGVRPGDVIEALRHLAFREGHEGPGPRHLRAFVASLRQGGRIHEARVTIDSIGLGGVFRQGLLPVRMMVRGKAPTLRADPLKTAGEVRAILDAAEASR